jgi:hypothetical protein
MWGGSFKMVWERFASTPHYTPSYTVKGVKISPSTPPLPPGSTGCPTPSISGCLTYETMVVHSTPRLVTPAPTQGVPTTPRTLDHRYQTVRDRGERLSKPGQR